jgi:para-nitrobenzyl esterase
MARFDFNWFNFALRLWPFVGAFHCAEIPYVFQNLAVRDWPWHAIDRRLAETMSSYWVNFAAASDPNGSDLPRWPVFDLAKKMTMEFGDDVRVAQLKDVPRLGFWDAHCD